MQTPWRTVWKTPWTEAETASNDPQLPAGTLSLTEGSVTSDGFDMTGTTIVSANAYDFQVDTGSGFVTESAGQASAVFEARDMPSDTTCTARYRGIDNSASPPQGLWSNEVQVTTLPLGDGPDIPASGQFTNEFTEEFA